jgi:pyruvate dehydrogenase complex dehydrogenase (E1) component
VIATLYQLSQRGKFDAKKVAKAVKSLGVDPSKTSALYA